MNRIDVLGVGFDNVTMAEAVEKCEKMLEGSSSNLIVTTK